MREWIYRHRGMFVFFVFVNAGITVCSTKMDLARYQTVPISQVHWLIVGGLTDKVIIDPKSVRLCTNEEKVQCYTALHGQNASNIERLALRQGSAVEYQPNQGWVFTLSLIAMVLCGVSLAGLAAHWVYKEISSTARSRCPLRGRRTGKRSWRCTASG